MGTFSLRTGISVMRQWRYQPSLSDHLNVFTRWFQQHKNRQARDRMYSIISSCFYSKVFTTVSWLWRVDVTLGLINYEEQKILTEINQINRTDRIDSAAFREKNLKQLQEAAAKKNKQTDHNEVSPNVYYVPLLWAADLVNQAMKEKRITDNSTQRILIDVGYKYCLTCFMFILVLTGYTEQSFHCVILWSIRINIVPN